MFNQQESLLLTHLMENYDREVRPVINASQAVVVRVGITLTQIFDMVSRSRYIYCSEYCIYLLYLIDISTVCTDHTEMATPFASYTDGGSDHKLTTALEALCPLIISTREDS